MAVFFVIACDVRVSGSRGAGRCKTGYTPSAGAADWYTNRVGLQHLDPALYQPTVNATYQLSLSFVPSSLSCQEPSLFNDTVWYNIHYGNMEATHEDVEVAPLT